MELGIIIAVVGVLALFLFTRKAKAEPEIPEVVKPTPPVDVPYIECLEPWREDLWEKMRLKSNTEWTDEEWASLEFHWGDPCYREAFIRHHGITAWNKLMAEMVAYEVRKAKRQAVVDQMEEDIERAEEVIAPVVDQLTEEEEKAVLAQTIVEVAAEREREQLGITEEELPSYQDFALQVNIELGGSYVAGMLTPPSWWTGTVTGWSRYVQQETADRWASR